MPMMRNADRTPKHSYRIRHLILRNGSAGCTIQWLAEKLGVSISQASDMVYEENRKARADGKVVKYAFGRYFLVSKADAESLEHDRLVDREVTLEEAA